MTRSHLPATLRRTSAAAVLVLALGSLAACGGDDDEPSAAGTESASASSEEPSEGADGGDETPSTDLEGEEIEPGEFIDVYGAALDNASTANFSMTVDGPVPAEMTGQMDFTTQPPATRMSLQDPASGQEQELTLVDGSLYVKIPGGKYYRTDLADSPLGGGSTGALDPRALLDTFEQAIIAASYLGTEDVDGDELEHYRIVLDGAAMQEASGETELPDAAVPAELTFDAYFGDDLLRRVLLDLGDQGGTVDVRYDDWGTDVKIVAPPASQVQQLPGS